jgi:hypothetical protein
LDVILEFMVGGLLLAIDAELEFAFFCPQHNRLSLHAPDHVEGRLGTTAQGHFEDVFPDAFLDGFAQVVLNFKEAVRRAQAADALMGALVVVMLDPQADALAGLLEVVELGAAEELAPDGVPEAFDLAQGHRMMGRGPNMGDAVLGHFVLEAARSAPSRILAAVVGEHLLGNAEFSGSPPVNLDDGLGGLAAEQLDADNEPRVIVHEGDQVGVVATQPEAEDVTLPHLVGGGPFEETGLGGIAFGPPGRGGDELLLVQRAAHRFGAGLQKEPAAQHLRDALGTPALIGLFERDNLLADGLGQARPFLGAAARRLRGTEHRRIRAALPAVAQHPVVEGVDRDVEQSGHLGPGCVPLRRTSSPPGAGTPVGIYLISDACLDDSLSAVTISSFRLRQRPIHLFVSWGINQSVTPNRSQCLLMNWSLAHEQVLQFY